MSEDSPTKRLSQIFESLSCLSDFQQQLQQKDKKYVNHHHHQHNQSSSAQSTTSSSSTATTSSSHKQQLPQQQTPAGPSSLQSQLQSCSGSSTSLSSSSNQIQNSTKLIGLPSGVGQYNDNGHNRILLGSRSTPNSPRLMPKRSRQPPAIPQRPNAAHIANPALVALDNDAPWPNFSSSNDHIDQQQQQQHQQPNSYHQGLPEVCFLNG